MTSSASSIFMYPVRENANVNHAAFFTSIHSGWVLVAWNDDESRKIWKRETEVAQACWDLCPGGSMTEQYREKLLKEFKRSIADRQRDAASKQREGW